MIAPQLPETIQAQVRAWHDEVGWCCVARGEGQDCCIEILLGDIKDNPDNHFPIEEK